MGEKEKGKKKAQPVYPGQSFKMYSNLINQKSFRFSEITLVTLAVSKLKMETNKKKQPKMIVSFKEFINDSKITDYFLLAS